jgi:hypothetical protein
MAGGQEEKDSATTRGRPGRLRELAMPQSGSPGHGHGRVDGQVEKVIEVVRAARSYQLGVWMADVDPEFAWLKFVSALETAPNCWWRGDLDPAAALETSKPELAEILRKHGGEELVAQVGATQGPDAFNVQFNSFTARYKPGPPAGRSLLGGQTDWTKLDRSIGRIYRYRSQSLHAGLPFPPAIGGAWFSEPGQPSVEMPLGLAVGFGKAVWQASDLPMHLHVFRIHH